MIDLYLMRIILVILILLATTVTAIMVAAFIERLKDRHSASINWLHFIK